MHLHILTSFTEETNRSIETARFRVNSVADKGRIGIMKAGKSAIKVLVLSDRVSEFLYSPAVSSRFADIDLVIACGDLPFPYLEFVLTMLNVPLVYVPGNHDRPTYTSDGRTVSAPEGAVNIDGRILTLRFSGSRSLTLVGFGGSMAYGGTEHQYTEWEMAKRIARLTPRLLWYRWAKGRCVDVLVTHAPPQGIHDGDDLCHRGFRAFLRFMRRVRPRYHLHGHVHPTYGYDVSPYRYQDTEVHNIYGYEVLEIVP
jgi:uncharacterized protein